MGKCWTLGITSCRCDYPTPISISLQKPAEGPQPPPQLYSGGRCRLWRPLKRQGSQRNGRDLANLYPQRVTGREMTTPLPQTVSACWTPSKVGRYCHSPQGCDQPPKSQRGGARRDEATGEGARGPATRGYGLGERSRLPHLTPTQEGSTHHIPQEIGVKLVVGAGMEHQCQVYRGDEALRRPSQGG